jgi:DNA invertase Pin-like site-specific DNA recombinase
LHQNIIQYNKMEDKKLYVAYYRVSTEEQGQSGLGLLSQQRDVRLFAERNGSLAGEFTEVESGKKNDREMLDSAIEMCSRLGATLLVKYLSRISRGGHQVMSKLEKLGVRYIESTAPYDNQLMKEFKFSMAKDERQKISQRTSDALQEIKNKISNGVEHISKAGNVVTSLGSPQNLTAEAIKRASEARTKKSLGNIQNKRAGAYIVALRNGDNVSFYSITKKLNENGFKTSRDNNFSEVQTKRLYNRYKNLI